VPDPGYGLAPQGYRLPPGARPGCVRLQVADLERSLAWYTSVLGVGILEREGARARLGAQDARGAAPLIELHEKVGVAPVPRRGRLGLFHYALLLPDRAALGRFVRHLAEIRQPAGASDHLVSEALYLNDPDGLGIEVYADRPRPAWRHQGRQLVMATDPLDLDELMAAAGDEAWSGLPGGTVMGHVHLHVGDLREAEAFYHRGLGLDKVVWSYPGALFLSAGGYHHHLGLNTWAAGAAPAGANDARLLEWELLVPTARDVARVAASLQAAGAAPGDEGEAVLVHDPWGTAVRIRGSALAPADP
jgi:catechol 2,3-dioxygenase